MRGCSRAVAIVLAVLGPTLAGAQGAPSPPRAPAQGSFPVRAGVSLNADSVRVGDPFVVTVGVEAPAGATIVFPDAADSTAPVQSLDPRQVRTRRNDTTAVEQYATYRVAAWDVGQQPVLTGEVVVRLGGAERRVALGGYRVFVRSVLPADSAQRVPKPARPLFESAILPWWLWALIALAVVAALLLAWWWWRRRRSAAQEPAIDPYERAAREFERLEALRLLEAGERGRFVALAVEVLRDYLAARYASAPLSLTSTELRAALRGETAVPGERLARVLGEADLVKFARRPLSTERARDLAREARAIVDEEHQTSTATPVAATTGRAA